MGHRATGCGPPERALVDDESQPSVQRAVHCCASVLSPLWLLLPLHFLHRIFGENHLQPPTLPSLKRFEGPCRHNCQRHRLSVGVAHFRRLSLVAPSASLAVRWLCFTFLVWVSPAIGCPHRLGGGRPPPVACRSFRHFEPSLQSPLHVSISLLVSYRSHVCMQPCHGHAWGVSSEHLLSGGVPLLRRTMHLDPNLASPLRLHCNCRESLLRRWRQGPKGQVTVTPPTGGPGTEGERGGTLKKPVCRRSGPPCPSRHPNGPCLPPQRLGRCSDSSSEHPPTLVGTGLRSASKTPARCHPGLVYCTWEHAKGPERWPGQWASPNER